MALQHNPAPTRPTGDDSFDLLARFFLARLSALARRQAAETRQEERTALARAIFSTYLDCRDLGLDEEADAILNQELLELVERSA